MTENLTNDNYYQDTTYMSASQFKDFYKCEAYAMAKIKGEWVDETNNAFLIGGYVDAYFSNELEQYRFKHPELFNKDGSLKKYVVSPYQMAVKEDKYFLICNYDKYNDITNYRVDRIKDIEILKDVSIKPFEQLDEAIERNLNLQEYMAEHIYMFAGDSVHARFRIPHAMIGDVIDVFGQDVRFMDETDTHVIVLAYVNEQAMLQYAKSFAPDVVVLGPEKLVEKVKSDLDRSIQLYKR
jgi:predicted DNA-binding transcriptional regulator YafY